MYIPTTKSGMGIILNNMEKTIKILKAQGVWGEVAKKRMIDDLLKFMSNVAQTDGRKEITKYVNKFAEND